jgi:hypothetical protein
LKINDPIVDEFKVNSTTSEEDNVKQIIVNQHNKEEENRKQKHQSDEIKQSKKKISKKILNRNTDGGIKIQVNLNHKQQTLL